MPNDIEKLVYSEYTTKKTKKSGLIPGLIVDDGESSICPRCSNLLPNGLEHGKAVQCSKCNLHMILFGNALCISNKSIDGYPN